MQIKWFGQSAFALEDDSNHVLIDPFHTGEAIPMRFDYPPISGESADLLLVTHEHPDHNNVDAVVGDPTVIRSQVGTHESPVGPVVAASSEHDPAAGTKLGHNVLYSFQLDGLNVVHLGDLGQEALRPAQIAALGAPDVLFVPVGGGITIDADQAAELTRQLAPRWVIGMHYQTSAIDLPIPIEAFSTQFPSVLELTEPTFETQGTGRDGETIVVVFPVPTAR
jgi:L-ascorbate metabolism protein UlaG (beta-lactamase superfamily)